MTSLRSSDAGDLAEPPAGSGAAGSSAPAAAGKPRGDLARFVVEVGAMAVLFGRAMRRGLRARSELGPELITQLRFTLGISWLPLILMSFALAFGPAGIQASNFLGQFGALDRLGGTYVLITVREIAPLVTAIILAGVAGTAICADIGARVVRGEVDALEVLGVDTIENLVAPRLIVLIAASLLFLPFSLLAGMLGALVVVQQNHAPLGPFVSTFFSNATTLEFAAAYIKCAIFAAIIATVCCYKGFNVSGGPEGVGRAVNQSVVIAFLAIGAIDYVFTQALLATNPLLSEVRG
jgi:phospholipid/cholesterol/gamma-HCH transport system permease protein